jgi:hypothetical protein
MTRVEKDLVGLAPMLNLFGDRALRATPLMDFGCDDGDIEALCQSSSAG